MRSLNEFINKNQLKVHFPIEIRFSKEDDILLSPSYGRDTCWIGIIMFKPYGLDINYKKYFNGFENIMRYCEGRPHWAKEFNLTSSNFNGEFGDDIAFVQVYAITGSVDIEYTLVNA